MEGSTLKGGWIHLQSGPNLEEALVPLKSSVRLKYVCFDVCDKYVVLGANSGGLYIFKKYPITLLHLLPNQDLHLSYISCSPDSKFIGVGSEKGSVNVYEVQSTGVRKIQQTSYCRGHKITAMTWNSSSSELFVGSSNGDIFLVNVSSNQAINILMEPSLRLFKLESSVFQLDYHEPLLLISTVSRTFIADVGNNSYSQIGFKKRNCAQGACWLPMEVMLYGGLGNHVAYCARPGLRLWESDCLGSVLKTFSYKELFSKCPRSEPFRFNNNDSPNSFCKDKVVHNFTKLIPFGKEFILSFDKNGFAIVRPYPPEILLWCADFKKSVIDVRCVKNEVYVQEEDGSLHHYYVCDIMHTLKKLAGNNQLHSYYELLKSCIVKVKPLCMHHYMSQLIGCVKYLEDLNYSVNKLYVLRTLIQDASDYESNLKAVIISSKFPKAIDKEIGENDLKTPYFSHTHFGKSKYSLEEMFQLANSKRDLVENKFDVISQSLKVWDTLQSSIEPPSITDGVNAFFKRSKQMMCDIKGQKKEDLLNWMSDLKEIWKCPEIVIKSIGDIPENNGIDVQITQLFIRFFECVHCDKEQPPNTALHLPLRTADLIKNPIDCALSNYVQLFGPLLNSKFILIFLRDHQNLWLFGTWSLLMRTLNKKAISQKVVLSVESNNLESLGSLLQFGEYPVHVILYILYHLVQVNLPKSISVSCQVFGVLDFKDIIYLVLHHFDSNNKAYSYLDRHDRPKLLPEFSEAVCAILNNVFEKAPNILVESLKQDTDIMWLFECLLSDQSSPKPASCECLYPLPLGHCNEAKHSIIIESLTRHLSADKRDLVCDIFYAHSYWKGYTSLKGSTLPLNFVMQLCDTNAVRKWAKMDEPDDLKQIVALRASQSDGNNVLCLNCGRTLTQVSTIRLMSWDDLAELFLKKFGCVTTLRALQDNGDVIGRLSVQFYRQLVLNGLEKSASQEELSLVIKPGDVSDGKKNPATDKSVRKHWGFKINLSCMICPSCSLSIKTPVLTKEGGIVIFPCKHSYHHVCLKTKSPNECPLCVKLRGSIS